MLPIARARTSRSNARRVSFDRPDEGPGGSIKPFRPASDGDQQHCFQGAAEKQARAGNRRPDQTAVRSAGAVSKR